MRALKEAAWQPTAEPTAKHKQHAGAKTMQQQQQRRDEQQHLHRHQLNQASKTPAYMSAGLSHWLTPVCVL